MKVPKLSGFTKITLAVAGVLFLVWLGLVLFTDNASTKTAPVVDDGQLLCPHCGKPLSKGALQSNQCPNCLLQNPDHPELAIIRKDKDWVSRSRTLPTVIIGSVILLLVANIGVVVHSRLRQRKDEIVFHYHCPKCSRKLRYRESQIGRLAKCPLCERPIVFPRPADFVESRWMRLRRWLRLTPPARSKS
jgi:DNA-directed RNA polymerase subunit RPC12/RpoP